MLLKSSFKNGNALPHTSLKTQEAIKKLGLFFPTHPTAQMFFLRFPPLWSLEDAFRGKRFGSDDEVVEEVKEWLRTQDSDWHAPVSC
jgi:hypothetical protein